MRHGIYLLLHNFKNGRAHSIQVMKTLEYMNVKQMKVYLVAPKFFVSKTPESTLKDYNIKGSVAIRYLFCGFFKYVSKLQIIFFNIRASIFLIPQIFKKNIDFIYFRHEKLILVLFIAFLLRIPFFFEVHRSERNKKDKYIRNWLIKNAKGVVVINPSLKEYYDDLQKNILIAECGYDASLFLPQEESIQQSEKICLAYAGGLEPHHGIDFIVSIISKQKNYELHIVGGSPDQIKRIKKCAGENCFFYGMMPYKEVAKHLEKADILLLPQMRKDIGAVSSKMYEYFGLGKPILATDIPANKLKMKENENACFYGLNNKEEFFAKLKLLSENSFLRKKMGEINLKKAQDFSFELRGKNIRDFVLSLI